LATWIFWPRTLVQTSVLQWINVHISVKPPQPYTKWQLKESFAA
jgi:hypothetical protein